jgi:peptide/nickel transport system permease protein
MLILIFAVSLGWLPTSGMSSFGASSRNRWVDSLRHLVLPVAALFLYILPRYVRLARESVLEVAQEDFITTARAIGYPERVVYIKFALRNALLPVVTMAGISLSSMFAGALLTETVFGWPGLGRLMYEAVVQRDFPVLMGGFLFTTVMVVVGSLVTDLLYTYLDPRVSY